MIPSETVTLSVCPTVSNSLLPALLNVVFAITSEAVELIVAEMLALLPPDDVTVTAGMSHQTLTLNSNSNKSSSNPLHHLRPPHLQDFPGTPLQLAL